MKKYFGILRLTNSKRTNIAISPLSSPTTTYASKLEPTIINMADANNNAPTNAIPEDEPALDGYERYVMYSIILNLPSPHLVFVIYLLLTSAL